MDKVWEITMTAMVMTAMAVMRRSSLWVLLNAKIIGDFSSHCLHSLRNPSNHTLKNPVHLTVMNMVALLSTSRTTHSFSRNHPPSFYFVASMFLHTFFTTRAFFSGIQSLSVRSVFHAPAVTHPFCDTLSSHDQDVFVDLDSRFWIIGYRYKCRQCVKRKPLLTDF